MEKIEDYKEIFKDHKLTVIQDNDICKIYEFRNPNNSNLWQKWLITNHALIVIGDAYESVYVGGAMESLESIAKCNIGYFNSKCVADRHGWEQARFDATDATAKVHKLIFDCWKDDLDLSEEITIEEMISVLEDSCNFYVPEIPLEFTDEDSAIEWLREYGDDMCGEGWWDGLSLKSLTPTPYFHLAAIKVAAEQLINN